MKQFYSLKILFSFVFSALSLQFYAQVSGVLKDSTNRSSVAFANIGLMNIADSSLVKGTSSDNDGKFVFKNVKSGEYLLHVSCIGYQSLWRKVEIKGKTDLEDILLKPSSMMLGGVEIVEKRPLFSMDGEKTMYNVEDDPAIQNGTTSDALQNAPGVSVDIDGKVTLEGVSCVEIWLNDEPSKIKSHNLKTFLDNLPANALKRIEVITHPSAKYSNSSGCGVINIITNTKIKKNHFISFGSGTNSFWDISPFVSYVWANEKLSFSIYASTNIRNRTSSNEDYAVSFKDAGNGGKDTLYTETTTNENESKSFGGWFSMDLNYKIDSTREISIWGGFDPNWSRTVSNGERFRQDFDYDPLIGITRTDSRYKSSSADTSFDAWGNFSANYRKKFDNEGHQLRISLNGNFSPSDKNSNRIREYSPASSLYADMNKRYTTDDNSYGLSMSARYTKPFSIKQELSCGLTFDLNNDRNYYDTKLFDSTLSLFDLIDTLRTYDKKTDNTELRGYVDWRQKFGRFTLNFGLNATAGHNTFTVVNDFYPADTSMASLTLRPNIRLSYRTKSMYDFSLSYSYSSSVPSLSRRTTFREYSEDGYSVGNGDLSRSNRHAINLNCSKFFMGAGYLMLTVSSDWNNNTISSITDLVWDEHFGRYVRFSMPYNCGASASQEVRLMGNIRLGAFANLNLFGTLSHSVYEIDYTDGRHYKEEGTRIMVNTNLWVKFLKNYSAYVMSSVLVPGKELFSRDDNVYNLHLGFSADFFKRKLSLSLSVSDPFNWNKISSDITSPYYHSHSTRVRNSRYIALNLTLRFGKLELENKQTSSSGSKPE